MDMIHITLHYTLTGLYNECIYLQNNQMLQVTFFHIHRNAKLYDTNPDQHLLFVTHTTPVSYTHLTLPTNREV